MDPKLGGVCQAIRMIISGLEPLGVKNEVVSLDAEDASFISNDPFRVNALGIGKGPWSYNPRLTAWLANNAGRFDAVIVHGLWLYYGFAVRKTLETNNSSKVFVMPHGMLDPYFQRASGRTLKAIRNYFYWKLIESKLVNKADGVLFTCEEECRLARQPFRPYKPKSELIVGLSIDSPPRYTHEMREAFVSQVPKLQQRPYILFLSRIHEKKGVDLLINAYHAIVNKFSKENRNLPVLVIAGPGLESPYGLEVQRLAHHIHGLTNSVLFAGMLSGDAKWGAFYGCEAFVLPSHQENFGIAVVEALGCGKPVLISNQINIWREIELEGAGLVGDDTLTETTNLLERWISFNEAEKTSMQTRAKNCFVKLFAKGPASKRFLEVLNTRINNL
jgi:glycosyltransferase involved in cell wall biosynthesis